IVGEGSGHPTEPQHTSTTISPSNLEPITLPSSSQPKKTYKRKKPKKVTEIPQSSEPINLVADEVVHEERGDNVERAATSATSLDADQDSGNITRTPSTAMPNVPLPKGIGSGGRPRRQETMGYRPAQTRFESLSKQSNDPPLSRVNILGSGEDKIKLKELMELCIKFDFDEEFDADMDEMFKYIKGDAEQVISAVVDEVPTSDAVITAGTKANTASAPVTTVGVSVSTAGENITTVEPRRLCILESRAESNNERELLFESNEEKNMQTSAEWYMVSICYLMDARLVFSSKLQHREQNVTPEESLIVMLTL
ncbi:hypothetical protein Tco_1026441, partial [Tanacetum coccineum]